MKKYFAIIIILIYPFMQLKATSYVQPEKKIIYSKNKKFYVVIDPQSNIHKIYNADKKNRKLWTFKKDAWHSTWLITNDGSTVVWISWSYVKISDINKPCIIIYNKDGIQKSYSYKELSKPRKYKKMEVGPIGNFWRVWIESLSKKNDTLVIKTSGDKKVIISSINGLVEVVK